MLQTSDRPSACSWSTPLFFFLAGCAFAVFPIANATIDAANNKDHSLWYEMGIDVRAGKPLYGEICDGEPKYMYPPALAVLVCAPLSYLGPIGFAAVFSLINAASWSVSVWASIVLVTGKWVDRRCWLYLAPGLAVAPYVWDNQLLGQTNLLLLAMTLVSFVALRNRRPVVAGTLFGTAVALKVFPLPAIAYFLVRREWRAVWAAVVTTLIMNWCLPGMVRGFDRTSVELKQWASLMIADQSGEKMAGRSSIGFTRRNQSLVSVSHRLLRRVDAGDDLEKPLYINLVNVSPKTAQFVGYGTGLLLGLVLLLACRFRFAPSPESEGLEIAMVCTLVPLCSPLAWTYFFCWLLVTWTAMGYWISSPLLPAFTRRIAKGCATAAAILLISAVSEQVDPLLQAYGVTVWGSVLLFLTLAYIRSKLPNHIPDSGPTSTVTQSRDNAIVQSVAC